MKTFRVAKGTNGLLLIEQDGIDIAEEEWTTRKTLDYDSEDVIVDPTIYKNHSAVYPAKSLAARLAKQGYIIFNGTPKGNVKYMLAVQYNDVTIS